MTDSTIMKKEMNPEEEGSRKKRSSIRERQRESQDKGEGKFSN